MALGPELYGLWKLLHILPDYGTYLHLGSRTAMRYDIPQLQSRQEQVIIEQTKKTVLTGTLVINTFVALIILLVAGFGDYSEEGQYGLIAFAFVIVLTCFYEHSISELKGEQNFLLVSKANYVRFSLNFLFTAALIFQFKLYGAIAALALSILLTINFLGRSYQFTVPNQLQMKLFIAKVKFGWPIVILDVMTLLLRSIDKMLIALYMGTHALGLYAIATMILGPLMNIPGASREVVEQKLMFKGDKLSQEQQINHYFFKPIRYTAYLMPALIGCACLSLPIFIELALPDYIEAIQPTQILLIGSYFLALSYPCRGVIVANNWQAKAALYASVAVVLNLGVSVGLLENGVGIKGVALSTGISFLFLFLILFFFVLKRNALGFSIVMKWLPELSLPFVLMIGLFFATNYLAIHWMQLAGHAASIMELIVFVFSYSIFALMARKYGRL